MDGAAGRGVLHHIWVGVLPTTLLPGRYKREKEAKWSEAVLRVNFPDRHVLQFSCHPKESLAGVYAFVRQTLEDPTIDFTLFQSPPITNLDDSAEQTLLAARMVPKALIRFRSG